MKFMGKIGILFFFMLVLLSIICMPVAAGELVASDGLNVAASFSVVDYNEGSSDKGSNPLIVKFTDTSERKSHTIKYWKWDLDGDGSYSDDHEADDADDADTKHTYTSIGTYNVSLKVIDENGNYSISYKEIEVVASKYAPVAGFSVDDRYGSAPFTVSFNDASNESDYYDDRDIEDYYWEFYDDDNKDIDVITSTSKNPTIKFKEEGKYTVRHTVVDEKGVAGTIVEKDWITVTSDISASFSASPTTGIAPLTVTFTANPGDYNIDQYYWNFGDGKTSSETSKTTSHTYNSAGSYSVTLTVYEGSNSYTTSSKKIAVNAKSTTPSVTYTIETTAPTTATPTEVDLSGASSGTTIFGIPGTEYFRSEMGRFYNFYEEYRSIIAGFFGMS